MSDPRTKSAKAARGSKRDYEVFLSYSSENQSWIRRFRDALKDSGVTVWFDRELLLGERWKDEIEKALRQSRILVTVLTPDSIQRGSTFFELGAALADHKRIVPVLSEGVNPADLPPLVRQFQLVREKSPEAAAKRVAEAVLSEIGTAA
ncbi:MAG TPA: toll/interleukin-1 receptor domain-containing protein [Thermoanaerobaculia bacterium]|nr:toll/interleukin-1 receptor domain-containing protein [Thermoanaerobaculia bacterium]